MKKQNHALAALGLSALAGIFAASTVPALSGCGEEYCGYRKGTTDVGAKYSNAQVARADGAKECSKIEGPIPASDTSGCPTTDAEIEALNRVYCVCSGGTVTNGKCSLQAQPLLTRFDPADAGDDAGVRKGYCRYQSYDYLCENYPIN